MVTFRTNNNNNNRRPPFRNNNNRRPPFRSNNEGSKFSNNNNTFQRKVPSRNNHNASKLIEKYTEMAREALAQEDRVSSENYLQHADHFTRVQNEQESIRMARINSSPAVSTKPEDAVTKDEKLVKIEDNAEKKIIADSSIKKEDNGVKKIISESPVKKAPEKKILEKKSAVS